MKMTFLCMIVYNGYMVLKVIQLNLWKGKFLNEAIDFLKSQDSDLVLMQEVTSGPVNFFEEKDANLFEILKERLELVGVFHSDVKLSDEPNARFGNVVFSKNPILEFEVFPLRDHLPITLSEFTNNTNNIWADFPRHMLDATIDCDGREIHAISVHGRRIAPPADDEENLRQARLMAEYIKSLKDVPFVMGGDFNMPPDSQVIKIVSDVSNNLMKDKPIGQTLNPRVHELGDRGYLVDYIFASGHFSLKSLEVPQVDISDHLPVIAELEF